MGAFYSPQKESARSGVRDPNMSRLEAGHIHQSSLEPGLGTRHVRCRGLTRVKAEEPDMSDPRIEYVREQPLEPGCSVRYVRLGLSR
jgi:hypothetical protein